MDERPINHIAAKGAGQKGFFLGMELKRVCVICCGMGMEGGCEALNCVTLNGRMNSNWK